MRIVFSYISFACLLLIINISCKQRGKEINVLLDSIYSQSAQPDNQFYPQAKLEFLDSMLRLPNNGASQDRQYNFLKANVLLNLGNEKESIRIIENIVKDDSLYNLTIYWKKLALAYLRLAERSNCITMHAAESCILPVKGLGIHTDKTGSTKAIEIYEHLLSRNPDDLESRWLLNIAYMTLGEYPIHVPEPFVIPGMEGDTTYKIKPFVDVAADLNLNVNNMAGGVIVDDFNNDGYLDLIMSSWDLNEEMHYFKNNADGSFSDLSETSGLKKYKGGLNITQADYNNDGWMDILVLRGAWKTKFGHEPNSLLRNNGDNTFTDVTLESGLLSFHPTQTATWNDFNNDGWLDLFIGNENYTNKPDNQHPCELYLNNQDGTFTEVAKSARCNITDFVKGVTSGDYDNDGWTDIFISSISGHRRLLKNKGGKEKQIIFEDVTGKARLETEKSRSFPTWFWDYNNDGWLDIFLCDYSFNKSLAYYEAAEKLNKPAGTEHKMLLYKNNQDGTFTNVAEEMGLDHYVFAMGANFGDIDNDGFPDMYLGTGNPNYESLVPNKLFRNVSGEKFIDVTSSARVGHIQKGHGVSFADLDNDGDQDIYIEMGGAYVGDAYPNSFFLNTGKPSNNWIAIELNGKQSNRKGVGSRIKLTFNEKGISRSVYCDVNAGGSFGSSPLRKEIGIGQANRIDTIEVTWHGSGLKQIFKNIEANQFIKITEGDLSPQPIHVKPIKWILPEQLCLPGTNIPVVQ